MFLRFSNKYNFLFLELVPELINQVFGMIEVKKIDVPNPREQVFKLFAEIVQNWQGWLNWFR